MQPSEPTLSRIVVYPVKSLDGLEVSAAEITPGGSLQYDRMYALADREGNFINGKRTPAIHRIRSSFDPREHQLRITLPDGHEEHRFHLPDDRRQLEALLGEYFGHSVYLEQNETAGFPDDTDASGPTVISTATLKEVAGWFGISLESARRRFRANLEIDGMPAFREDQLLDPDGQPRPFYVGDTEIHATGCCQRCVVPTRDPDSGKAIRGFQKIFADRRAATLPDMTPESRFDHYYRLAVNTYIPGELAGQWLSNGMAVTLSY